MYPALLTKSTTFIIGPIATLLGYLMNLIFNILDKMGLPNVGLSIIIFTIVIYMLLTPLTYKQQKFSKLQVKMQPEMRKIQDKYKGRKDQDSLMRQQEETQALYRKYGVSTAGSCVQLLIQMPILFSLYRVIYNMPAYVTKMKEAFAPVVAELLKITESTDYLKGTQAAAYYAKSFKSDAFLSGDTQTVSNVFIDVMNRFSTGDWAEMASHFANGNLTKAIENTTATIERYNNFLGLNMGNSPSFTIKTALGAHNYLLIVGAIMIPVLAALTQWIGVKLMPTAAQETTGDSTADNMANSMKTMNTLMPLMSAWFCYTLPAGMGLYWIAGAVIRSIQQIVINKQIDKIDIDAMIKKNMEKEEERIAKNGGKKTVSQRVMSEAASMNTRQIPERRSTSDKASIGRIDEHKVEKARKMQNDSNLRKDSLAAKAGLVARYNNVDKKN